MPFNNLISRSDADALAREDASKEIIESLTEYSSVLQLAKRLPDMSREQRRLMITSTLPTAYFVAGDNGLKQTTEVNWTNKYIDVEELAVIVPVPKAVLEDSSYDLWANVKPKIKEAFGIAIDQAVLYGTNIPASWTTDLGAAGLVAVATAASQTVSLGAYADLYEAVYGETGAGADGVWMLVEADGFMVTGNIASMSMMGKMRNTRSATGEPIMTPSIIEGKATYAMNGTPLLFPLNGAIDASQSLLIAGDWSKLLYAMRQDITYTTSEDAVIQDGSGNITLNLFQQDAIALRAVMRLGFALPNPINRMNATAATRCAFAVLTA